MNYDVACQLLIIGDSCVGKTSLLTRYTTGNFKEEYIATVGIDYFTKNETINDKIISIKLWDTVGQERYKALTQNFFKNAEGVMVVYDITKVESFDNLKFWINSIKQNMENKNIIIPVIIIGNKVDMEDMREISNENAENFAKENNYKYFETSAKTGEGIDNAVRELVNQVLNHSNNNLDEQKESRKNSIQLNDKKKEKKEKKKKKKCC